MRLERLSLLMLGACASVLPSERNAIPLNLDFSVAGVVDQDVPWGWSFRGASWVGVEVSADAVRGRLTLHRAARADRSEGAGGAEHAQLVYDLADAFAKRRVAFRASVDAAVAGTAGLRIGVRVLDVDWDVSEAFSDWRGAGVVEAEMAVPENSYNVQLVVEYRGSGTVCLDGLTLAVDGKAAGSSLPAQPAADPAVVEWARARAIPLQTTDFAAPLDDLDGLLPLIGDRRLLLLGESTHGSSEFFEWKARFVRWLALRGGPVVFVIEDHPDKADRIDRFIRTGEGDARAAVKGLFGFWGRQEVVDLVQWMREATLANKIELTFAGVDMQVPLGPISRLDVAARALDADLAERIEALLRPMRAAWEQQRYPQRDAPDTLVGSQPRAGFVPRSRRSGLRSERSSMPNSSGSQPRSRPAVATSACGTA